MLACQSGVYVCWPVCFSPMDGGLILGLGDLSWVIDIELFVTDPWILAFLSWSLVVCMSVLSP